MKVPLCLSLIMCACQPAVAQTPRSNAGSSGNPAVARTKIVATTGLPAVIDAVLRDFPDNLRHISGELLLAEGESENYVSIVAPPGAERCIVTRYHSSSDSSATWQARMYSNEDFGKASRTYHALYRELQSCYLLLADSSMIPLKGKWEPAREEIPFTTSTLRLNTGDERYREVAVDLELLYEVTGWVVNINIIGKRPDDEIGGIGQ